MDDKFKFTYSALTESEKKEIERIKHTYTEKPDRQVKLERVRRLDYIVKEIPGIIALTVGIFGTLIFGVGMTMVLEWELALLGVTVGAVGALVASSAYLLFRILHKKLKDKYSKEILELSEELLNVDERRED